PDAPYGVEEVASRVGGHLGAGPVVAHLEDIAVVRALAPGVPVQDEAREQDRRVDGEAAPHRPRALRDVLAEQAESLVEVVDRLEEAAGVEEGETDVALEERLLLRVAARAMDQQVEPGRLAEVLESFGRGGRARRLVARREEVVLRLLEVLRAAEVI